MPVQQVGGDFQGFTGLPQHGKIRLSAAGTKACGILRRSHRCNVRSPVRYKCGVLLDGGDKFGHALEHFAADAVLGDQAKKSVNLVDPKDRHDRTAVHANRRPT